MPAEETKMLIRSVIVSTNYDNLEETVDFLYNLLFERGVTI